MLKSFLNKVLGKNREDDVVTIVSGLPRSGTSMMMRMLEAGGIPIITDNIRKPDEDNPRGYYEFEKVKKIKKDASWLKDCHGKAFKMVSMLLYDLPAEKKYNVIFMQRNIDEIIASQNKMLKRSKKDQGKTDNVEMARLFGKHLNQIEKWLETQNNINVIYVSYNNVIQHPAESAEEVNRFLGNRVDVESMLTVVDKSLYRNRADKRT